MGQIPTYNCGVYDTHSIMYIWDPEEKEFKGLRFSKLLFCLNDAYSLMSCMDQGYYAVPLYVCNYVKLMDCRPAFSIQMDLGKYPKFKFGFEQCCQTKGFDFNNLDNCNMIQVNDETFLSHSDLKNYAFVRPAIESCNCLHDFWIKDEFDKLREQLKKEAEEKAKSDNSESKEEGKKCNSEISTQIPKLRASKEGRGEAAKFINLIPNCGKAELIKKIDEFSDKNLLAAEF
jgi:hypothetical protein